MNNKAFILNYYEFITIVMAVLSIAITLLIIMNSRFVRQSVDLGKTHLAVLITPSTVKKLLFVTIIICITLLYTQVQLGLGFVSGPERQVVQLPYRLAGIIMTIYNWMVPLLFLVVVWFADKARNTQLTMVATGSYLLFGMIAGLLSTSKASMLSVVISLAVLWVVTGTLTKKRFLFLSSLVPFIMLFSTFLGVNRILRGDPSLGNPDLGIFEIMLIAFNQFFSPSEGISVLDESLGKTAQYIGLVMRVNGADSLMNIMNWNPPLSFDRIWFLLFKSSDPVYVHYAIEVLGRPAEISVAFSTSLLGYFMFLGGNVMFVSCCAVLYTVAWHIIFRAILSARLLVEPIALALLIVLLGQYTSEGTLEAMPMSLAVIGAFVISSELVLRQIVGQQKMQGILYLSSHLLPKRQD